MYSLTLIPPGYDLYKFGLFYERRKTGWKTKKTGLAFIFAKIAKWELERSRPDHEISKSQSFCRRLSLPHFHFKSSEYFWWWVGQPSLISSISILLNCFSKDIHGRFQLFYSSTLDHPDLWPWWPTNLGGRVVGRVSCWWDDSWSQHQLHCSDFSYLSCIHCIRGVVVFINFALLFVGL